MILHDVFDADQPCAYVFRPDRHIGYRGHSFNGVSDYLADIFLEKNAESCESTLTSLVTKNSIVTEPVVG